MKSATPFAVILVTAPSMAVARKLARIALERKLVACVNIVPRIESVYWWKGKIESDREVLLVLKSRKPLLARLESLIQEQHPYDTPEFLVLPLSGGSQRYLDWLRAETS